MLKQCEYCYNQKECSKNQWVTTCDKGYKIKDLDEYMCDNFKANKGVSYTAIKE